MAPVRFNWPHARQQFILSLCKSVSDLGTLKGLTKVPGAWDEMKSLGVLY